MVNRYVDDHFQRTVADRIDARPFVEDMHDKTLNAFIYYYTPLIPSKLERHDKQDVIESVVVARYMNRKFMYSQNIGRLIELVHASIRGSNDDDVIHHRIEHNIIYDLLPRTYRLTFIYSLIQLNYVYDYIRIMLSGNVPALVKYCIDRFRTWNVAIVLKDDDDADAECPICYDVTDTVKTDCGHALCKSCVRKLVQKTNLRAEEGPCCPMCRSAIKTVYTADRQFAFM
jgi:hypothetical protein